MAFTVDDFHDLIQLLEAHPAWKQELRRIILTDEVLALPALVRELADKLVALTERVDALAARVEALTGAQQHTEARLAELAAAQQRTEARLEELAAAQQRTEARLEELAAAQQRTEARLEELAAAQQQTAQQVGTLAVRVDTLRGDVLETRFRERAPAYLGSQGFRRTRVVPATEWVDRLDDALDAGRITAAERAELLLTDAVVRARDADGDVWLAVEVSATVDTHDVERARRRAALLARLDGRARGVVAGHTFTAPAEAALQGDPTVVGVRIPEK
ncbi:MAG: hypothetical protein K6V97_10050 [Actinomycetia bacterium]|nr:hypothetical protein [Actinomycetes bacterium]